MTEGGIARPMKTKKKTSKSAVAVEEAPRAGVLPKEHEERIDIERTDLYPADMVERHRYRYLWAMSKITERFVRAGWTLDAACGTGYGSHLLLNNSARVVGLDRDEGALSHARKRFGGSLLNFRQSDFVKCLPLHTEQVDAAVSIETIEHLTGDSAAFFLSELKRVLVPGGLLLLSTPQFDEKRGLTSTFHIKEYTSNEITALVTAMGFVDVQADVHDVMPGFIFLTARRPG